jgi:hypothetical protein
LLVEALAVALLHKALLEPQILAVAAVAEETLAVLES